jgi:hypothetical protein
MISFTRFIITAFLLLLFLSSSVAQTPKIPGNTPGGNQLPLPKIKPLKKVPDLGIQMLEVISAVYNEDTRTTIIKVMLRVSNNGTMPSAESIVTFDVHTHAFEGNPDRIYWQQFGESFTIQSIPANSSVRKIATFTAPHLSKGVSYRCQLRVNPFGAFEELSVNNNQTAEFEITIE